MHTLLISVSDLAAHPDCIVIDCRHNLLDHSAGRRAYLQSHLAQAHFLDMESDLSGEKTGRNGRHPLPDPAQLTARLGNLGIGPDTQIVAYDQNNGMFAARLWWLARWLGHARVAVLDGGLDAWVAAGQATECSLPSPIPVPFPLRPSLESPVSASTLINNPTLTLLDARSAERFQGRNESMDPVAGHIPGALNRPIAENLGSDGCFKPAEQLRAEFVALLGHTPPTQVVHYCGSGISALHNRIAMDRCGLSGSLLYPGSWSEWVADPSHPVAC